MMRVLISNGESLQIEKYEGVVVQVNGDNTKGVKLYLTDITEADVRNLLSDMDNFATIGIYTDKNILTDELSGYQTKISVALGEEENNYIVTLAQGTDTTAKVKILSSEVSALSKTVEDALKVMSECTGKITDLVPKLEQMSTENTELDKKFTDQSDTLTQALNAFNTAKSTMQSAISKMTDIERKDAETNARLDSVLLDNTTAINAVNEAVSRIGGIYTNIDQMTAGFMAKVGTMNSVLSAAQDAKDTVAENNNHIQLALGKTEKIDDALKEYGETIKKQDAMVEEKTAQIDAIKKTTEEAVARVAALEPVSDITTLPLADAKKYRVAESQQSLARFLEENPIESSCHNGITAKYSITAEKQRYLQAMILIATTAEANGVDYQPSWNIAGEPCTYDWTIPQLQQLAMEIEGVVRPLVSHQQSIERDIMQCTTIEELMAVQISYKITVPEPETPEVSNSDTSTEEV